MLLAFRILYFSRAWDCANYEEIAKEIEIARGVNGFALHNASPLPEPLLALKLFLSFLLSSLSVLLSQRNAATNGEINRLISIILIAKKTC